MKTNYIAGRYLFLLAVLLLSISEKINAQCSITARTSDSAIVCGSSTFLSVDADWEEITGINFHSIRSINVPNRNTIFLSGDSGSIYRSIDGGNTYAIIPFPKTTSWLNKILFQDSLKGIVFTDSSEMYGTLNGGKTWTQIPFSYTNPPGYTYIQRSFHAAFFPDTLTGYAGGGLYAGSGQSFGFLHKTSDGGQTWTQLNLGSAEPVRDLYFFDSLNGYAACDRGIYKTTNGGQSWTNIYSQSSIYFDEIKFMNRDTGFICFNGGAFLTTNQGQTWNYFATPYSSTSICFDTLGRLYLIEYSYQNVRLWRSANFGKSWVKLNLPSSLGTYFSLYKGNFDAGNPGIISGYTMAGRKFVIRGQSLDSIVWWPSSGMNDSLAISPEVNPIESSTYFVSAKAGNCVAFADATVWVTPLTIQLPTEHLLTCGESIRFMPNINIKDSGSYSYHWSPSMYLSDTASATPWLNLQSKTNYKLTVKSTNGCEASVSTVAYLNFNVQAAETAPIKCGNETQLKLLEPGWSLLNLQLLPTPINNLRDITAASTDTLYLMGGRNLWRSVNRGKTWETNTSGGPWIYKGFFRNPRLGFLAALDGPTQGVIMKTTNGTSWQSIVPGNYQIPSLWFTSDYNGYAIGNPGKILKSINGGNTWIPVNTNTTSGLQDIFFTDANTGYAVGYSGTIVKTTNSGSSWIAQTSGTTSDLYCLYFISSDTGFAGGSGNTLLRTVNGGQSWSTYSLSNDFQQTHLVYDIQFISSQVGYAITTYNKVIPMFTGGAIFETRNGGVSWNRLPIDSSVALTALLVNPDGFGMAVGGMQQALIKPITPSSYSWSPANSLNNAWIKEPMASPKQNTQYIVTGYYQNCFARDTVWQEVNSFYTPSYATKSIICGDSVRLLQPTVYIEIDAASYGSTWEILNASNNIVMKSTAGVKVKDNYALPVGTYVLKVRPKVIPPPLTLKVLPINGDSINQFIVYTADTLLTYTFSIIGTNSFQYNWSPKPSLSGPLPAVQTYKLQVLAPNGCEGKDSINVTTMPLLTELGSEKNLTCGSYVSLDTLKTNYTGKMPLQLSWSNASILSDSNSFTTKAAPKENTWLKVRVTTNTGCVAIDSVKLTVDKLTLFISDTSVSCKTPFNPGIQTNYMGTQPLQYQWMPASHADFPNAAKPFIRPGSNQQYTLQINTWNNCSVTDSFLLTLKPKDAPDICLVTVNNENKNIIIWNKNQNNLAQRYTLFRETNVTNVYEKIAELDTISSYLVTDTFSNPFIHADKYRLNMVDVCGIQTQDGPSHKTMHLTINKGMGNSWNLIWNSYEGIIVSTYNIYRGTDSLNMTLIGTSSGSNTAYSDLSAPAGNLFYQVELITPYSCNPGKTYNSSRSNLMSSSWVGLEEAHTGKPVIFPNPAHEYFQVEFPETPREASLSVRSLQGVEVMCSALTQNRNTLDISALPAGIYVLIIYKNGYITRSLLMKD